MELVICDIDCFVEKHGASCNVESVCMLHLDIDTMEILVPREGWRHFHWCLLLLFDLVQHDLILVLHFSRCFFRCHDSFVNEIGIKRVNHIVSTLKVVAADQASETIDREWLCQLLQSFEDLVIVTHSILCSIDAVKAARYISEHQAHYAKEQDRDFPSFWVLSH